jgi:hypothetical protein
MGFKPMTDLPPDLAAFASLLDAQPTRRGGFLWLETAGSGVKSIESGGEM